MTSYLDGTLPADERPAFDEHMALCPGCDRYLVQFKQTIELLRGAFPRSRSPHRREISC